MRAGLQMTIGDQDAARTSAEQAVARDPTFANAHFFLVDLSLRKDDYAETRRLLEMMYREQQIVADDLLTNPKYANFLQSQEYRDWVAGQPDRSDESM
jgi:Tfp pilus assembly protein PilF